MRNLRRFPTFPQGLTALVILASMCLGPILIGSAQGRQPSRRVDQRALRIEPAHWFSGTRLDTLQLLIHGPGVGTMTAAMTPTPGARLIGQERVSNPDYLFVNLFLGSELRAGTLNLTLTRGGAGSPAHRISYPIKPGRQAPKAQGYGPADMVYLIMPDRFANGDPSNDNIPGMREQANRKAPFGRHGGDLQGISQRLGYLQGLGATTLWLNPVQENDMPSSSYHGYAITDFYAVDRRFGGMPAYKRLIDSCHARGMKVVMDMVMNHIGTSHYWLSSLPDSNWLNQWPQFTNSNFRLSVMSDPYASDRDKAVMNRGWFANSMADLNQRHPLLARYLIQNCLWWVEESGIDGIRMDTYPYPDPAFMNRWASTLLRHYPNLALVGEVWVGQPSWTAYWTASKNGMGGFRSTLPTITDFPVRDGILAALNEGPGWDNGMTKLYNMLAQDFLYDDPSHLLTFVDNHDVTRLATAVGGNRAKMKQALILLATLRGVPQIYYGTEIGMAGDGGFHPDVRKNMPGGWPGDSADVFTGRNVSADQQEMLAFTRRLYGWRKTNRAVAEGRMVHFIPEDNVYVYGRQAPNGARLMVVVNGNNKEQPLRLGRYAELLPKGAQAQVTEVMSGQRAALEAGGTLTLPAQGALIYEWVETQGR